MLDNYLLEELVSFAKNGTLAKAADELGLSQPAITRGTKKLEEELGVTLFNREPNKITLTETGEFAAQKAEQILAINKNYVSQVKNFDTSNKTITVASISPGPLIIIQNTKQNNVHLTDKLINKDDAQEMLQQNQYSCIITNQQLKDSKIDSTYLGMEHLTVHLNEFSDLANKQSIKFTELNGLSFLVLSKIGVWKNIIQDKIEDANFLYQNDEKNFKEIKNYSVFPYFTTNISNANPNWNSNLTADRVAVKIADPEATQTFYANYLKKNKKRLKPVIENWQDAWESVD